MNNYTIRLFLDTLTIVEYNLSASNMFVAEDVALRKFADSGLPGRIRYLTTEEKRG